MIVTLQTQRVQTLEQVRRVAEGNEPVDFALAERASAYEFIRRTVVQFDYAALGKQAYSKVLIFGWSSDASVGVGRPAGEVGSSCRRVVGLAGRIRGVPADCGRGGCAWCRALGSAAVSVGCGAQRDGGFMTASRASCGRAA